MIRPLSLIDVKIIRELYESDFPDGWSKTQLLGAFNTNRFVAFGSFFKDELVGVITISLGYDDADLEGIVVRNDFRRNKIATSLLEFALEYARKEKKQKIFLEVRESNISAIEFYSKNGFNEISVRKNYYPNGENAKIMVKEL